MVSVSLGLLCGDFVVSFVDFVCRTMNVRVHGMNSTYVYFRSRFCLWIHLLPPSDLCDTLLFLAIFLCTLSVYYFYGLEFSVGGTFLIVGTSACDDLYLSKDSDLVRYRHSLSRIVVLFSICLMLQGHC
jgi:hypothetical protein